MGSVSVHVQTLETRTMHRLSQKSKVEFLLFMSVVFFIAAGISVMAYFVNAPSFYSPAILILQTGSYQITSSTSSFAFPVNQGNVSYDSVSNTIVMSNFPEWTVVFVHATVSSVEHPETVAPMNTMMVTGSRPLTLPMVQSGLHLIWNVNSLEVSTVSSVYVILSGILTILFFAASVGTWLFWMKENPKEK